MTIDEANRWARRNNLDGRFVDAENFEQKEVNQMGKIPELPSRFTLPFGKRWVGPSDNRIPDAKGYECCYGLSDVEASWLKDLINAAYSSPPPDVVEAARRLADWEQLKRDNFPEGSKHCYFGVDAKHSDDTNTVCRWILGEAGK